MSLWATTDRIAESTFAIHGKHAMTRADVPTFALHGVPTADKLEWRPIVLGSTTLAIAYRYSAFGYSLAGAMCMVYDSSLRTYDAGFWWSTLGAALIVQGFVAYMSDVVSWGYSDTIWRWVDPKMASILFVFFGPGLAMRGALGLFAVPSSTISIWLVACIVALFCKTMGARATYRESCRCEELMLWHTGWHSLPFVAAFCVLDLAFGITHAATCWMLGCLLTLVR